MSEMKSKSKPSWIPRIMVITDAKSIEPRLPFTIYLKYLKFFSNYKCNKKTNEQHTSFHYSKMLLYLRVSNISPGHFKALKYFKCK